MNLAELFKNEPEKINVAAGKTLFKQGEVEEVMYVLVEGEAEIQINGRVVGAAKPGDVLGEMGLIETEPHSATAVAKTNCTLVPIDEKRFCFLVQQTPYFATHVMKVLADRLRHMSELLAKPKD